MNKRRFIGIAGKPRSGKNTAQQFLGVILAECRDIYMRNVSISQPAKNLVHRLVGTDFREDEKDTRFRCLLNNKTPRDAYIKLMEFDQLVPDCWARFAWDDWMNGVGLSSFDGFICESIGKQAQWDWFVNNLKDSWEFTLVHVDRPGLEWDSREPIHMAQGTGKEFHIQNNGTLEELKLAMEKVATNV